VRVNLIIKALSNEWLNLKNNSISGQRLSADLMYVLLYYNILLLLRVGGGGGGDGSVGPNSTRALPVVSFAPPIGTQLRMHRQLPSAGCTVASIACGAMWSNLWVVVIYLVIVVTGTLLIS